MNRVFIYGNGHVFRVIEEWSLVTMKVEVFDNRNEHALSLSEIKGIPTFEIAGHNYRVLWLRHESDERGPYTAVGLQMVD